MLHGLLLTEKSKSAKRSYTGDSLGVVRSTSNEMGAKRQRAEPDRTPNPDIIYISDSDSSGSIEDITADDNVNKNEPDNEKKRDEANRADENVVVESIVGEKEEDGSFFYKVRWKGYGSSDDTWVAADDIPDDWKQWWHDNGTTASEPQESEWYLVTGHEENDYGIEYEISGTGIDDYIWVPEDELTPLQQDAVDTYKMENGLNI